MAGGIRWGEKDHGWDALKKHVDALRRKKIYVKAGILGKDAARDPAPGEKTPIDNVKLGMIHEFGAPAANIPERSFIRQPFDANRARYLEALKTGLKAAIVDGEDFRKVLGRIGLAMVRDMRARIRTGEGVPPPLKPATIAAKGSSRPLVDSGQLVRSISSEVVIGAEGAEE